MATTTKLDNDDKDVRINETKYRGMTRLLLYLMVSRPDIVFSVGHVCTILVQTQGISSQGY